MNVYYIAGFPVSDELWHYGVAGQKHGVRRYQNTDGSYTALGRRHYGIGDGLKKGASGDEVKSMQKGLAQLGYSLNAYGADGKFGTETQVALNKFKKDHNLPQDGVYDKKTQDALIDSLSKKMGGSSSSTSSATTSVASSAGSQAAENTTDTASDTTVSDTTASNTSGKNSSGKKKSSRKSGGGEKNKSSDGDSDMETKALAQFRAVSGMSIGSLMSMIKSGDVSGIEDLLSKISGKDISVTTSDSSLRTSVDKVKDSVNVGEDFVAKFLNIKTK